MTSYSFKFRSLVSTWFSLTFFLLLIFYIGFIEFFQNTRIEKSAINLLSTPIRSDILDNVNSLKFKNRIGKFTIIKDGHSWILQEPRIIPAKTKTINDIINTLRNIKIHTIHQHDPINFQSFSLDKPVIEIELFTKLDEKIIIKVGLINPINNTSYITVSGHNRIFQTNLFKGKLETLELSDFIDSQVFSMSLSEIKSIQIFHGKKDKSFNSLSLSGNNWKSKKYNIISNAKIDSKIRSILNLKTHMIIDKKDEGLQTFINNYLKSPMYTMIVKLKNNQLVTYRITYLVKAISDLKIEKKQYFIVSASNRPYPYVINKKHLDDFLIRYSDIKP